MSKNFNREVRITGGGLYVNETEIITPAGAIVTTTPIVTTDLTTTGNTLLGNGTGDTCAVSGTLSVAGLITATAGITGKIIMPSTQTIAAGGTTSAIDLTKFHHDINADAGGDVFTVANGTAGQLVLIVLKTATGTATITPATFLGGTSILLNDVGESVLLYYSALGWQIVGGHGFTVS